MILEHTRALCGLALFLAALLVAANAPAGDDDERPAYMIYIDPETGRYTTEDPFADAPGQQAPASAAPASAAPATPGTDRAASTSNWLRIAAAAAAGVVLLAIAGRHQLLRRRNA